MKSNYIPSWLREMREDPIFGKCTFKLYRLDGHADRLIIGEYSIVNFEEFNKVEPLRIPLLLGCQFGIFPRPESLAGFYNEDKYVAIINKSVLSGLVSGVTIYQVYAGDPTLIKDKERIVWKG